MSKPLFYRDRDNGVIAGVCAGLADSFDVNVTVVRLLAIASLIFFFVPTLLVYVAAGLLLGDRPLWYHGSRSEAEFWSGRDRRHAR